MAAPSSKSLAVLAAEITLATSVKFQASKTLDLLKCELNLALVSVSRVTVLAAGDDTALYIALIN
jgi:hypothetical protein